MMVIVVRISLVSPTNLSFGRNRKRSGDKIDAEGVSGLCLHCPVDQEDFGLIIFYCTRRHRTNLGISGSKTLPCMNWCRITYVAENDKRIGLLGRQLEWATFHRVQALKEKDIMAVEVWKLTDEVQSLKDSLKRGQDFLSDESRLREQAVAREVVVLKRQSKLEGTMGSLQDKVKKHVAELLEQKKNTTTVMDRCRRDVKGIFQHVKIFENSQTYKDVVADEAIPGYYMAVKSIWNILHDNYPDVDFSQCGQVQELEEQEAVRG
ncbi:hypothetical protein NE237_026550 [Protea cynaroides]|uniref:Uncharacterized protein n=1 Tax=Protea cynaroides TaxID=273540 RepID=A0A9Q0H953_9MAGN|nr:hypothetical protein NE237_026550 [Protea cynaroides]